MNVLKGLLELLSEFDSFMSIQAAMKEMKDLEEEFVTDVTEAWFGDQSKDQKRS